MNGPDFSLPSNETANSTSHGSGGSPPAVSSVATTSKVTSIGPLSGTPVTHGDPTSLVGINSATNTYAQVTGAIGPFGTLPSPSESLMSTPQSNGSSAMSLSRQKDSVWKKISLVLGPVMIGAAMAI